MTDDDFATFDRAFRRVSGAHRVRLKPAEHEELARTFFRVLKPYSLAAVLDAGMRLLRTNRGFPKPADWVAEIENNSTSAAQPPDVRVMSVDECYELAEAERLHYDGPLCSCAECVRDGVTELPLRFVPNDRDDGVERAWNPSRNRLDTPGHWAHGNELGRWYVARATFFASAENRRWFPFLVRSREDIMDDWKQRATGEREPGEDDV